MKILTSAAPSYSFNLQKGGVAFIATTGVTGAGIIKHQYKHKETDTWTDNPNFTFATTKHLHFKLEACAVFNQITVTGADGTTAVNVDL